MGRPPKGTEAGKIRSIRVEQELWDAAREIAATEGRTITDVITDYLRRYVARARR